MNFSRPHSIYIPLTNMDTMTPTHFTLVTPLSVTMPSLVSRKQKNCLGRLHAAYRSTMSKENWYCENLSLLGNHSISIVHRFNVKLKLSTERTISANTFYFY